jgi:hypothetical protein
MSWISQSHAQMCQIKEFLVVTRWLGGRGQEKELWFLADPFRDQAFFGGGLFMICGW